MGRMVERKERNAVRHPVLLYGYLVVGDGWMMEREGWGGISQLVQGSSPSPQACCVGTFDQPAMRWMLHVPAILLLALAWVATGRADEN